MAVHQNSIRTRTSELIKDPYVAAAFAAAEKDDGAAFAIPACRGPKLSGGATEALRAHFTRSIDVMIDALDRLDASSEDLESGFDDEPYLAGFGGWADDGTRDLELDEGESGIADADGIWEQTGYWASVQMECA